jgi:glycerophosphoryl diester phosphodiesterase
MLRRRKSDPPHLRANLVAALQAGAACEVDLVFTADGHALCLHDMTLDRETTGSGPVAAASRAAIERLRQRGSDGAPLGSAPLFLDEVADTVRRIGVAAPALVQLDVKPPAAALTAPVLAGIAAALGRSADAFVAGGYEWDTIERLRDATPGLHAGFDPLAFYPRDLALDAAQFQALGVRTRAAAPDAAIYYLEANLVLAALDRGVDLVAAVTGGGALVDAWTVDADRPALRDVLRRLVEAGCHQITSNDPEILGPIVEEIAACS